MSHSMVNLSGEIEQLLQDPNKLIPALQNHFDKFILLSESTPIFTQLKDCRGVVAAYDPEYNRQILSNPSAFYNLSAQEMLSDMPTEMKLMSQGLSTANGQEHQHLRRLLLPLFSRKAIFNYFTEIKICTQQLLTTWHDCTTLDLQGEMYQLCNHLANRIILGTADFGEQNNLSGNYATMVALRKKMSAPAEKEEHLKIRQSYINLTQNIFYQLKDLIAEKRKTSSTSASILDQLVHLKAENLIGIINTLFLPNYESMAVALTWTLLLLSQHPVIFKSLHQTIASTAPHLDTIENIPLLKNVIAESLRLLPPSAFLIRHNPSAVDIKGVSFPPHTEFWLSPFLTQHAAQLYPNPTQFIPDRWQHITPSIYEYLPFGAGPRICIGYQLALLQLKVTLFFIVKEFYLALCDAAPVNWNINITLAPATPIKMALKTNYQDYLSANLPVQGTLRNICEIPL